MLNTQKLIKSIDEYIELVKYKSTSEELETLYNIRNSLANASSEAEQMKWYCELIKIIMLIKEFFDHL